MSEKKFGKEIVKDVYGNSIFAKSPGQQALIQSIEDNDITFINGPSGSGKSYLTAAMAAKYLKEERFKKIIISRPIVEAGEKIGFLPGELSAKLDPYMAPLYGNLKEFLRKPKPVAHPTFDQMEHQKKPKRNRKGAQQPTQESSYSENTFNWMDKVQVSPLAYLRGTTFKDSLVIFDESQNCTPSQMKMLLTRIGSGSKFIINGDIDQCDLPLRHGDLNGLDDAMRRLELIDNIGVIHLSFEDVMRHPIIKKILKAYDTVSVRN